MKLVFASTFDYPSRFAHAIHGLEMARALARACDLLFVCNTAVDPAQLAGIRYRELFGPYGRRVKKLRLRRILFIPRMLPVMLRERPDVIYTTEPGLYGAVRMLARLFGARFLAECHGALTPREERALSAAHRIFFVTEGLRARFLARYPALAERAIVLPNAVDAARFDAVTGDTATLRKELSLPEAFLIGYIGRFEPLGEDKGLRLMIDALPEMSLDTYVILVGGAKAEVEAYRRYAEERGMAERVRIVPHVSSADVPRYAKACDVLCYVPPKTEFTDVETSPMKLYEYMAAERPIIVSDTRAMREALRDDEALFVEPGSRASFVAAVTALRSDLQGMRERARRVHTRIASMTWDTRAERISSSAGIRHS